MSTYDADWYYLSFAAGGQFLGGAYVQGATLDAALLRATLLGINPGGEVAGVGPIGTASLDQYVPPRDWERLLTRAELGAGVDC